MKDTPIIIGYDAKRIVRNGTGLGNYSRTLIKNIIHTKDLRFTLRLYAPDQGKEAFRQQIKETKQVYYVYPHGKKGNIAKAWWRFSGINKDLINDGVQLYHGLSGELPKGIHDTGIKTLVTIHDLIFLRFPKYYNWLDVQLYKYKFQLTCKEADRIIAISECTKRDIIEFGGVDPSKITVVYQDCEQAFKEKISEEKLAEVKAHYNLPDKYLLNVGSIEERKNVLLAVKAFGELETDAKMVIVGKHTPYTDKVIDYITAHKLQDKVMILHGVPFADLPSIYQLAHSFVYPSRYEGFGIPIIEALYSHLPVVACTGSCLEEAGGTDSIYVDPDDVEGMKAALLSVLSEVNRAEMIEKGLNYVKKFDTLKVTKQLINEYQALIK